MVCTPCCSPIVPACSFHPSTSSEPAPYLDTAYRDDTGGERFIESDFGLVVPLSANVSTRAWQSFAVRMVKGMPFAFVQRTW